MRSSRGASSTTLINITPPRRLSNHLPRGLGPGEKALKRLEVVLLPMSPERRLQFGRDVVLGDGQLRATHRRMKFDLDQRIWRIRRIVHGAESEHDRAANLESQMTREDIAIPSAGSPTNPWIDPNSRPRHSGMLTLVHPQSVDAVGTGRNHR